MACYLLHAQQRSEINQTYGRIFLFNFFFSSNVSRITVTGLSIFVSPPPPNLYIEVLTPQSDGV